RCRGFDRDSRGRADTGAWPRGHKEVPMGVHVRPASLQDGVAILTLLEDVGYYPEPISFAKPFRQTLTTPHFLVRVPEADGVQTESFDFPGPAGRLEAVLMRPEGAPVAAAVVCHAHPLQGGIMHFKVVFRAAKALQHEGVAALRFNFRGVGRSEGVHDHGRGE